jgi:hypothetical protein
MLLGSESLSDRSGPPSSELAGLSVGDLDALSPSSRHIFFSYRIVAKSGMDRGPATYTWGSE